jgi:hypothetical protein
MTERLDQLVTDLLAAPASSPFLKLAVTGLMASPDPWRVVRDVQLLHKLAVMRADSSAVPPPPDLDRRGLR